MTKSPDSGIMGEEKRKGNEEMKRSLVGFFAVVLLCSLSLFACSSPADGIVGRWETEISDEELGNAMMVYHFTEKGEIYLEQREGDTVPFSIPFGTWELQEGTIRIVSNGEENRFAFSLTENSLTLTPEDGSELVFRRV